MMSPYLFLKFQISLVILLLLSACQTNPKLALFESNNEDVLTLIKENDKLKAASFDEALEKARKSWQDNKIDLAQSYYIIAFNFEPDNIELLEEMARVYRQLNKTDQVELCYKLILEQQPHNPSILQQSGLMYLEQKKLDQAETMLLQVVQTDNPSWQAYNGLGIIEDLRANYQQAQVFYLHANDIFPDIPQVLNNIGYSLYMENKLLEAAPYFLKVLKAEPGFKKALHNYALIIARQKNYDKALLLFAKIMTLSEANNNTGYIAMMNNDYALAEYYFNQALILSPRFYRKAHENLVKLEARKYRSTLK